MKKAVHRALLDLVPLAPHHDSVTVGVGFRAGNEVANHGAVKAADAFEEVAHLRFLDGLLSVVIDVLILATTAGAEMFAARLHALGRGFQYLKGFGAGEGLFLFGNLHQHNFAGDDKRHKDHKAIYASDAFAAEGHVVNRQFNAITDIEGRRRVGLGNSIIHQVNNPFANLN